MNNQLSLKSIFTFTQLKVIMQDLEYQEKKAIKRAQQARNNVLRAQDLVLNMKSAKSTKVYDQLEDQLLNLIEGVKDEK